jgi:hypothetical protein
MEVAKLEIDRTEARRLQREYKSHRAFQTAEDREIERTYRLIAAGKVVIQARESIRRAGLGADGFPKLGLVRADAKVCHVEMGTLGQCRMWMNDRWMPRAESKRLILPDGTFAERTRWGAAEAMVPLIPVHLRPRTALDNYHILFEAEWRRVPPRDPYLLRHVGGDIWVVLAAWDLTEVERAAMATRLNG